MSNLVRLIVAIVFFVSTIVLFVFGHWGWGILGIFFTIILVITYFYNENMLIAQWYLRKENMEKAEVFLGRINNYEKELSRLQHGYYQLLLGLLESRKAPMKSEKFFKSALNLGLRMDHNVALAKISLAGIAMAKRNKREAQMYLTEAKKADKNKLLADQIKQMKDQLANLDRMQQVRYGHR